MPTKKKKAKIFVVADVNCTEPGTPANGHRLGNSFKSGKVVLYWCNKGYRLRGTRQRSCRETGKWSGVAVQCTKIGESESTFQKGV